MLGGHQGLGAWLRLSRAHPGGSGPCPGGFLCVVGCRLYRAPDVPLAGPDRGCATPSSVPHSLASSSFRRFPLTAQARWDEPPCATTARCAALRLAVQLVSCVIAAANPTGSAAPRCPA